MNRVNKYILSLFSFLFFAGNMQAQNTVIDSLTNELSIHTQKDTVRVYLLNTLAFKNYGVDHKKLKEYTDEANALAKEIKFVKGEARSLYMFCVFHLSKNELEKASIAIQESLSLYEEIKDEGGISSCYDIIGTISNFQGNYDKAIEYYTKALKIAKKRGAKKREANYKNNIGGLYQVKGNYNKALKFYKEALAIDDSLKTPAAYGTLNNIGIIYTRQGRYLEALECFQKSLPNFRKQGNKRGVAAVLLNMGAVYSNLEDYEKELPYQLEALEIQKELGNELEVSKSMLSLGDIYQSKKKYEKALDYFNKALEINKKINSKQGKYSCYSNIGSLYTKTKQFDLALSNFKKGLDLSLSLGNKRTTAVSHIDLGTTYYNLKNYKKAYKNAIKGKIIADELSILKTQKQANLLLSKLYEKNNNYKAALKSFKEYKKQNDSTFNKKNIQKITQLEYEYKYKQKLDSASIRELKLTKTVTITTQDLEKSQRNYLLAIIGVLLISILLGGIIFFLKLRNEKSKNHNIAIEQKLLRSQMTPHFIFNSLSVLQGMVLNKENKKAVNYLSKFSKLLRITLENSRDKIVSLSQELTAIENYLSLQNLENESYKYTVLVDNTIDIPLFKIPPMLIQPFVENAIEHGFENQKESKKIDVHLTYVNKELVCTITDNGTGIDSQEENKNPNKKSLSTTITSERLKILSKDFNMKGLVIIEDRKKYNEQGTVVTLVIPYKIQVA